MPATPPAPTVLEPLDPSSLATRSDNREQDDPGQAQDVAEDARHRATTALRDSDHGPSDPNAVMPDDTPDLIDKMNEMVTSGHIDNGAFAGEPMHDDEEDMLGDTDPDDDDADAVEGIADGSDEDYLPDE